RRGARQPRARRSGRWPFGEAASGIVPIESGATSGPGPVPLDGDRGERKMIADLVAGAVDRLLRALDRGELPAAPAGPPAVVEVQHVQDPLPRHRDAGALRSNHDDRAHGAVDTDRDAPLRLRQPEREMRSGRLDLDAIDGEGAEIEIPGGGRQLRAE